MIFSKDAIATLSDPNGVGTIVAEVPIIAAALNLDIPADRKTGYKVANRIIAKFEALGITNDNRFPIKKTMGIRK